MRTTEAAQPRKSSLGKGQLLTVAGVSVEGEHLSPPQPQGLVLDLRGMGKSDPELLSCCSEGTLP